MESNSISKVGGGTGKFNAENYITFKSAEDFKKSVNNYSSVVYLLKGNKTIRKW